MDVFRQISQARVRAEKAKAEEEKQRLIAEGEPVPEVSLLGILLAQ